MVLASAFTLVVYGQEVLKLLLKADEVFSGVFDTSVPTYPLVGILFLLVFAAIRRQEFARQMADNGRRPIVSISGIFVALLPLAALLLSGWTLVDSYAFDGISLVACWVGAMVALRPSLVSFLFSYLVIYVAAVGSVDLLTTYLGDPLSGGVALISSFFTWVLRAPVEWSSTSLDFVAAGGQPVSLYISQECSGIASISIFLLLMGLMHLDIKPRPRVSIAFAFGGSSLFLVLNSIRVVMVIEGGIAGGVGLMWSLHGWVGYPLYVLGYAAIVLAYMKRGALVDGGPADAAGIIKTIMILRARKVSQIRQCLGS
ncbi:MAG TPA: exosortase/archaeosortase family protein [Nitrososphaerales archaeon]|nr:exosortase/archaeosortase family protein [Nitrososphaerales archaeon]